MSTQGTTHSYSELGDELAAWLVGGGVLTMALFPLAVPLLLLTVVAALPILVIPVIGLLIAAPILLLRRLLRRFRGVSAARERSRSGAGAAAAQA